MNISIEEFKIAMEMFCAKRLQDQPCMYGYPVPCFEVKGINFLHSGSSYITTQKNKVPETVMNQAMSEFGEKDHGGENFWLGDTFSVKGILTIAAMLEGRYTKELINKLHNETYKKLFDCPLIQNNDIIPFQELLSPKMEELRKLLFEYDNMINPFGNINSNINIKLKDPIEYSEKIKICFSSDENHTLLRFFTSESKIEFHTSTEGLSYSTKILTNPEIGNVWIIDHYYIKESDTETADECISLSNTTGGGYLKHPGDFDLIISMKTGLTWKMHHEKQATPATDEQIEIMITNLKIIIKDIQRIFVSNMLH